MEKLEIIDGAFKKDDPHKDIGKQKFRVKRRYSMWVEYDVVADSKDEAETAVSEQGGVLPVVEQGSNVTNNSEFSKAVSALEPRFSKTF